jgi:ribosomal protein S18 acetylase RimI-like enzyme
VRSAGGRQRQEVGVLGETKLTVPVRVRYCTEQDLPRLEWFGHQRVLRSAMARTFQRARAGEVAFLVAELNGFPVARVSLDLVQARRHGMALLWSLAVMPNLQGLGIGTLLLSAGERVAAMHGLTVVELAVAQDNVRAQRLYERLGYQVVGERIESHTREVPQGGMRTVTERCRVLRKNLTGSVSAPRPAAGSEPGW